MGKKNFGPCSIINCVYKDVTFRLITELAYQKCYNENMLEIYPYLEVGKQLCHPHYCKIVKPNCGKIQYKRKRELKDQEECRKKAAHEDTGAHLIEEIGKEGNVIDIKYKAILICV